MKEAQYSTVRDMAGKGTRANWHYDLISKPRPGRHCRLDTEPPSERSNREMAVAE